MKQTVVISQQSKVPAIQANEHYIFFYNGKEKDATNKKIGKLLKQKQADCSLKKVTIMALPDIDSRHNAWPKMKRIIRLCTDQSYIFIPCYISSKKKQEANKSIRFGRAIKQADLIIFNTYAKQYKYLRARVFALGSALDVDPFFSETKALPIAPARAQNKLEQEIEALRSGHMYFAQAEFELFITKAKNSPTIVHEIGRCREIVFRAVGEGTNKEIDVDEYDLHYLHLLLWDKVNKKIAGAYRLGDGKYIMERYGPKGFYIRSLFKIKDGLFPLLRHSLELGRSFVSAEYQQKRLPLFLLWKGIHQFVKNNKHIDYIIGPVSISNQYSKVSQSVIVKFVRKYYYNKSLAKFVRPKNAFKPDFKALDTDVLFKSQDGSTLKLDYLLEDVDLHRLKLPVLYKKYFQQNAKIIGFNRDPLFNDALDGFMVVRADELLLNQTD